MTHFLVSDEKPDGYHLEDILRTIRKDVFYRCTRIHDDSRPEAQQVLANNVQVLHHLTEAIRIADDSTQVLNKAFGPSRTNHGGPPRIGVA